MLLISYDVGINDLSDIHGMEVCFPLDVFRIAAFPYLIRDIVDHMVLAIQNLSLYCQRVFLYSRRLYDLGIHKRQACFLFLVDIES